MFENMNEDERYEKWFKTVTTCYESGWKCVKGFIFTSPSGTNHDLSCADLTRLSYIEKNKSFLVI